MIFDDDYYEHKLCFGLADFLCVIDKKSFAFENLKSKVERTKIQW